MDNILATLSTCINQQLEPLINSDYVLWDLPYYVNIGDILIWQGELDFLKTLRHRCIDYASKESCLFQNLSESIIILLQGGGNFGDIYLRHQEFRLKVVKHYPNNRIIMFPQSVWYEDESLIEKDAKIFAAHKNLYLCARDRWSYEFMKKHFSKNNILLIPDMAFCIDESRLVQYRNKSTSKKLYFKRLDKEATFATPLNLGEDYDVHDWPTIENNSNSFHPVHRIWGLARRLKGFSWIFKMLYSISDTYASKIVKNNLVKVGCEFLAPYGSVITTRLHAMILSVLLYKPVEYIDNTTGKLSAFVDTWLYDVENVTKYGKN